MSTTHGGLLTAKQREIAGIIGRLATEDLERRILARELPRMTLEGLCLVEQLLGAYYGRVTREAEAETARRILGPRGAR